MNLIKLASFLFLFLTFCLLVFMRDTYEATMRHLFFVALAWQGWKFPSWQIQVGRIYFGGVGKVKKGQKARKTPCGQTRKLCYARLPGL